MASNHFPTTLADLNLHDATTSTSLYKSIRDIRKSALSMLNRLTSIVADADYVQSVAQTYRLPVVANERCGSWYVDPDRKAGSAYFKSTDGHHGQWGFSLRRLNLQLLSIVGQYGGAIVVDSTRRGKNIPDAFLKTVPIWVAVMNQVLFPEQEEYHILQCPPPPDDLGLSEVSQIETRLDKFVTSFLNLGLEIQELRRAVRKPIRICWEVNGSDFTRQIDTRGGPGAEQDHKFNHLILCSASRRVIGAEMSQGGYIQGAGDDSEAWSHGLTPQLFWQHKDLLLTETAEDEFPIAINRLMSDATTILKTQEVVLIKPTSTLHIGPTAADTMNSFDLIIDCTANVQHSSKSLLAMGCREGKLGSRDLREELPVVIQFVDAALEANTSKQILITCPTCKDLSAGVALMLLCAFYNDGGEQQTRSAKSTMDKAFIKRRLAWISASMPIANPSRATLQSVNAFLMARPRG